MGVGSVTGAATRESREELSVELAAEHWKLMQEVVSSKWSVVSSQ